MWNWAYDELYTKAKSIIKKDTCMKFYNEKEPLYLKKDSSGVALLNKDASGKRGDELLTWWSNRQYGIMPLSLS